MSTTRTDWSIYSVQTGELLPFIYFGDRAHAEYNAPAGHAVIEGKLDHRTQCVVLVTDDYGDQIPIVAELPPVVPADPLAEPRRARLVPVMRAMAAIDALRVRPMSEAALALAGGPEMSQAAKDKLLATEVQLQQLRAVRQAIEQATSQAELDAITWP